MMKKGMKNEEKREKTKIMKESRRKAEFKRLWKRSMIEESGRKKTML